MDTVLFDTSIISLPKLNPFSTYYWRVRANNRRGWSPWSETFLFRTNNINLTAPILKTPQNGKVTIQQNIELAWNQSFRAKFYRLQISVDSLFTSIIGFDSSLAKSDFQFSMKSNTKYFWRVKATGIDKTESNWSEVWNFKRLLPSPTQLLPENKSVNLPLNIKMKWYSPDISLRFHVEISSKADFSEIVFNQTTLGDTILYAALPSNFTTFYWRIRWIYTDGSQSDWSEVWSFTTMLARPRLDSPGDKVTGVNLNPTLTWNSVPGGMYYHLQLAYDSEFKQKIFEDSLLLVIAKPLKSLLPLTNYYWHVRSIISNGSSEWSEIWSFKTGEEVMSVDNEHRIYNSINIAPQPASGLTSIHLNLLEYNKVTVVIIDLLGRIVYEYPQTNFESGKHSFPFQLATEGVYICKVTIGSQIVVQKFVY